MARSAEKHACRPIGLLFDSFYPPHGNGMWMRGRRGRLRLADGLVPGEPVVVGLKLIVAPWGAGGRIALSVGPSTSERAPLLLSADDLDPSKPVIWRTNADASGIVAADIIWDGALAGPPDDPRRFAIGLGGIAYLRGDDSFLMSAIMSPLLR